MKEMNERCKVEVSGGARKTDRSARISEIVPAPARRNMKRTYADSIHGRKEEDSGVVEIFKRRKRKFAGGDKDKSIVKKIMMREMDANVGTSFSRASIKTKFKNIRLQDSLDTYDPKVLSTKMPWLRRRSKVVEIVSHKELIFTLTHTGMCAAFDRDTRRRICFLNIAPDEVIRSLFLNKTNDSLITVSVFRDDGFSSLKCRSTPLLHIRKGNLDSSFALFESETLRWPGFVEFDDVNLKVLTFSAVDKVYKVWDLRTYRHLYTIRDDRIKEIKISPGVMLLIHQRFDSYVPMRIIEIETGHVLKDFNHLLHRNRQIDFVEQFHEKLLVKQENMNLQIVDVRSAEVVDVARSQFLTPHAFIFLYENQLFLTFRQHQVSVWNFNGQLVTNFEDHTLWHPDSNTNSIYITAHQDLIISYCKKEGSEHGSINVSWISNGKSLAKISCDPRAQREDADSQTKGQLRGGSQLSDLEYDVSPPEDVTALYYNEERNEIYTGTHLGMIHIWSN